MSPETIAALVTGVSFLALLLIIACYIAFRPDQRPIPGEAMFIFRVVLSLAAGAFAATLPGFLEIQGNLLFTIRASGALAVFIIIYKIDPPDRFEKKKELPSPKEPREIAISENHINTDEDIK